MDTSTIPKKPGIYTLIITIIHPFRKKVGKLGYHLFPKGVYTYTGSAIGVKTSNLKSRISRHLNPGKKHWHIDYLLSSDNARIESVVLLKTETKLECTISQTLTNVNGAKILVKGFGSSDCHRGCKAHLLYYNMAHDELATKIIEQYEPFGIPKLLHVGKIQQE